MSFRSVARREAIRALVRAEKAEWSPPDWEQMAPAVRPLAREVFSGVLRHRARLDWTLAPLLSQKIEKLDAPVRAALRCALYERLVLETPAHALGSDYAGLMRVFKLSSAAGLVNALCRRLPESFRAAPTPLVERLATEFSHPRWLVERYLERNGEAATEALLRANQSRAPLVVRVNTRQMTRDELQNRFASAGFAARASLWSPDALILEEASAPTQLPGWNEGWFAVQDEAAQMVGRLAASLLATTPDFFAVDAAAAPGGKTTHLAQLGGDGARILACDSAPARLRLVEENARRLQVKTISTRAGDWRNVAADLQNRAHLVLLDAPCLGTGTFRRRPDAKWRKTPADLAQLVALQAQLLDSAAGATQIGGFCVYSTCSLENEENQGQIVAFLQRHRAWRLVSPPDALQGARQDDFLIATPSTHGSDGMFAAALQRTA